jgi:hypothetical protein
MQTIDPQPTYCFAETIAKAAPAACPVPANDTRDLIQ